MSESNRLENIEVSVVIPCLNEANSLALCVDKARNAFASSGIRGEVVVADNGSTDGSIELAEEHGARVVHVKDRGYGSALRGGIAASRGEFIIMGDADDSYDFSTVPDFVRKWREGYDVVMGNRFRGEIKPGAMPWSHRYIGNPGLTAVMNIFFRTGTGDCLCGLRGFTRAIYDQLDLRTSGMEWAPEFVIKSALAGARMTEIPIVLWPDKRGRPPHLRSFSDGWRTLRFMLLYAPNWLFIFPGVALMAVGLFLVFWLVGGPRNLTPGIQLDTHTMIFGVLFTLLGAQIVSVGFCAKVFSYAERFDRNPVSLKRALRHVKLEHGLFLGAGLALIGFIGDTRIFWSWVSEGFGRLHDERAVLFWSLWFVLGVQILFSSFLLSMLGIS
ncbi:MAG: glycosyltransferase family 2 protein, partial [Candidatus Acidiferrales bacterium]